jgi:hypothetical protein
MNEYLRFKEVLPNRFPANKKAANKTTVAALPISNPPEEKPHPTHAAKQAVADREKNDDDTDSEDEDTSTPCKARAQVKRVAGKTANKQKIC